MSAELPVPQQRLQPEPAGSQIPGPQSIFPPLYTSRLPASFCLAASGGGLKVEGRHAQLGHHPKRPHLAYLCSQRGMGGGEGASSSFHLHFGLRTRVFSLIPQQNKTLPLTELCGMSRNSSVGHDLTG